MEEAEQPEEKMILVPKSTNTALIENNIRIKNELEIVTRALDNSLKKIKKHQERFRVRKKKNPELKRRERVLL